MFWVRIINVTEDLSGFLDEDEIIRMDPSEDKTGEHKKRAVYTAIGAALGAFFGDVFYGREVMVDAETPGYGSFDVGSQKLHWEYRDHGGFFDSNTDNGVLDRSIWVNAYRYDDNGNIVPSEFPGMKAESFALNEGDLNLLKDSIDNGYWSVNESVMPDGALIGGLSGGATTYLSDYLRKRFRNDHKREEDPEDAAEAKV